MSSTCGRARDTVTPPPGSGGGGGERASRHLVPKFPRRLGDPCSRRASRLARLQHRRLLLLQRPRPSPPRCLTGVNTQRFAKSAHLCPVRVWRHWPSSTFHTLILLSPDPLTSCDGSVGLNWTQQTKQLAKACCPREHGLDARELALQVALERAYGNRTVFPREALRAPLVSDFSRFAPWSSAALRPRERKLVAPGALPGAQPNCWR